jgi:hypothetical protein
MHTTVDEKTKRLLCRARSLNKNSAVARGVAMYILYLLILKYFMYCTVLYCTLYCTPNGMTNQSTKLNHWTVSPSNKIAIPSNYSTNYSITLLTQKS